MTDPRDRPPVTMALPLDVWVPRLLSDDPDEVERASEALGASLSSADEALRDRAAGLLLRTLGQGKAALTAAALRLLQVSWFPPSVTMAEQAVRAVLEALQQLDGAAPEVEDAALLLANVCREEPSQLAAVVDALGHDRPALRRAAAGALGRIGELAAPHCAELAQALDDRDHGVVDAALLSLCALAPLEQAVAAPALLRVVRAQQGQRRYAALAALRGLLEETRLEGLTAPAGLDGAVALMAEASAAEEAAVRLEAAVCLGLLGDSGPAVKQALQRALQDPSSEVAAHAAAALLRLGSGRKQARTLLEALLFDPDQARQQAALTALEGLEADLVGQGRTRALLEQASRRAPEEVRQALRELLGEHAGDLDES